MWYETENKNDSKYSNQISKIFAYITEYVKNIAIFRYNFKVYW